jgi:adenylate cyclase
LKLTKIHWAIILCIVPLILTVLLKFSGFTESLENNLIDLRYRYANPEHPFTDKLVIVDIDEVTLDAYKSTPIFGRWPWKRNVYQPILEYIAGGMPKLILFDIMFFEESPEDDPLIEATEALGIVSHAVNLNKEDLSQEEDKIYEESVPQNILDRSLHPENVDLLKLSTYNILQFPIPRIAEIAPYVHAVTYTPDSDGVGRRGFIFFKYRNSYFSSLGFTGYLSQHPQKSIVVKDNRIDVTSIDNTEISIPTEKSAFRLHYYSKETIDHMPRISMSGVIDSRRAIDSEEITDFSSLKVPPTAFTDKVVIIGTSAASTSDTRLTPYGDRPGYMYHAIQYSNLMEKHFLHMAPEWLGIGLLLIMLPFNVTLSVFSKNIGMRIVVPALLFIIYPLIAFLVFRYDIHLPLSEFAIAYPLTFLGSLGYLTLTEGAEKRKYSKVLSNMVDPTIVSEALTDLEALKKGGEMEITAFFSDVAGFSTISEQLSSADLAALLNEYLSAMTIILKLNKGTLDKYIGDAVVGIFGAPIKRDEHFLEAARASLEMISRLAELKKYWKENNLYSKDAQDMDVRIGLNTGKAKVGFMGTDTLASYTMMGDTVNLAARLEAAGKDYGVNILISENTNLKVKAEMFTRELDAVRVKGKNEPVKIFELISKKGESPQNIVDATGYYEEGFNLYLKREWEKSIQKFTDAKKAKGKKDKAVEMLIERCTFYLENPPEATWDGVFTRTHK